MRSACSRAIPHAAWLAVVATMLTASGAEAQWNNSGNYGNTEAGGSQFYYTSEDDRRQAIDRDRKYEEQQQRDQREYEERKEKEQRRRDARVEYVPKAPEQALLVVNYDNATVTADKMVDSMFEAQSKAAQADVKVPPKKEGFRLVTVGEDFYYYKDGVFFIDMGDSMAEVPGPPGALVTKLPPGFEVRDIDSGRFFVYKGNWYERVMVSGTAAFKVVPKQE